MSDVETARKRWIIERPEYEAFAECVKKRLKQMLKPGGFWFEVSARAKEIDSLVKKLLKKSHHTYESLPDKVGARVIVRFRADISPALKLIRTAMVCDKEDPKDPGIDRVGYQSVHLDGVSLPDDEPEIVRFPRDKFWVELQVRTLAQHLWSEMSHDTIYKNDETVSALHPDIRRRVNLMAGQIEVADREFDRLNQELPADANILLLKALERHYYTLSSRAPDPQLSLEVLPLLTPLYHSQVTDIVHRMDEFVSENRVFLQELYSQFGEIDRSQTTAFLSQPELLMIYERLTNDSTAMRKAWNKVYPEKELERIAVQFGLPFS
jgi:ppGpp synthetase/RelA/SpoT-type nucleotidyltranferase